MNIIARIMGLKTISPDKLNRLVQDSEPVSVIDVNSRHSWRKAHVPGALNLDPAGFGESELPANKESSLVFYCSNPLCRKAPKAGRRAKKMGYNNVKVMSAGINGWLAAGLQTESMG